MLENQTKKKTIYKPSPTMNHKYDSEPAIPLVPEYIIKSYRRQAHAKQHYCIPPCFVPEKFTQHPYAIGQYPATHSYVVHQFAAVAGRFCRQVYSHEHGGNDHDNPPGFEFERPAGIFYQPQQYMGVLPYTHPGPAPPFATIVIHGRKLEQKIMLCTSLFLHC